MISVCKQPKGLWDTSCSFRVSFIVKLLLKHPVWCALKLQDAGNFSAYPHIYLIRNGSVWVQCLRSNTVDLQLIGSTSSSCEKNPPCPQHIYVVQTVM